jgi:hypothetical protein
MDLAICLRQSRGLDSDLDLLRRAYVAHPAEMCRVGTWLRRYIKTMERLPVAVPLNVDPHVIASLRRMKVLREGSVQFKLMFNANLYSALFLLGPKGELIPSVEEGAFQSDLSIN